MSLNCIEIENIIKYIKTPCIITSFSQLDDFSLIINTNFKEEIKKIIISVKDNFNRITIIPEKENLDTNDLRFSQYLNANVKFYCIKRIYQVNYSRIVIFEIENEQKKLKLVSRLWGVGGNILLIDENDIIIECLKRYPKRNEWINNKFIIQNKDPNLNYNIRDIFKNSKNEIDPYNVYFYYKDSILNEEFNTLKKNLISVLKKDIEKVKIEIENLEKFISEDEEKYLKIGELIKSYSYQITKGDKKIKLFDYEKEKEIEIELDPDLTPIENAKKYFDKYKKIRESKEENSKRLEFIKKKLIYLENTYNEISNLNKNDIEKLIKKKEEIIKSNKKNFSERSYGREFILSDSYRAIVSRNAKESKEILSKVAKGNDYWFHIRDYSGSHVIVKHIKNKELTQKAKLEAAHLAFYYSKGNKGDEGDIYFTQVKYLHKPNSKTPGLVIPVKEKNIKLKFDKQILENIFLNNERY